MIDPHLALGLSVAFVCAGPLLAWALDRREGLRAALDGLVLVAVAGLCLVFLLPHAWETLGGWALLLAAAGLILPVVAERKLDDHGGGASRMVLGLALGGVLLHSFIDGVGLGSGHDHHHDAHDGQLELTLAILFHRLPVGLLIWSTVRPWLGRAGAWGVLGGVVLATGAGFGVAGPLGELTELSATGVLDALLAGGLLHVVIDEHHTRPAGQRAEVPGALGALVALAGFGLLPLEVPEFLRAGWAAGVALFCESSLPILLGFLGAGLLSLVSTKTLARLMTGRTPLTSAMRGVIFGLPIPICSCGVVPIYRGLMGKGVPAAAAIAFLIATPELGVDAVALSLPLLGWKLTVVRLVTAFAVATLAGLAVHFLVRGDPPPALVEADDGCAPAGSKVQRALRYGFVEALDDLGPWILAGIAIAGLMQPLLDPAWIAGLPSAAQVPLFAGVATPFYVCATAATPVAAVLLAKGVQAGAVVAFLLAGPATNVTTYGALRLFHGRRTTALALLTIVGSVVGLGFLVDALPLTLVDAAAAAGHEVGLLEQLAGGAFCLLLLASLFRQGPRGFLRRLGLAHSHSAGVGDHGEGGDHGDHGDHEAKPPCCGEEDPCASEAPTPEPEEPHRSGKSCC